MKGSSFFPTWLALLLLLPMPFAVASEVNQTLQASSGPSAADSEQASTESQPRKRLRFRDGPVCMCGDGLKESDIAAGRETRRGIREATKETPKE